MVAASRLRCLRSWGGILLTTCSLYRNYPHRPRIMPYITIPKAEGRPFEGDPSLRSPRRSGVSALISSSSGAWMTTHRESPPHGELYSIRHLMACRGLPQDAQRITRSLCPSEGSLSVILMNFLCPSPLSLLPMLGRQFPCRMQN